MPPLSHHPHYSQCFPHWLQPLSFRHLLDPLQPQLPLLPSIVHQPVLYISPSVRSTLAHYHFPHQSRCFPYLYQPLHSSPSLCHSSPSLLPQHHLFPSHPTVQNPYHRTVQNPCLHHDSASHSPYSR